MSSGNTALAGVVVLVVDDQTDPRDLLVFAFEHHGAKAIAAGSAEEALDALGREHVDVIVSDVAMPDADGYDLIHYIRSLPGETGRTPAIALTALVRPADRDEALAAGFQRHVAKPFDLPELVQVVAEVAAGRSAG